LEEGFVVGIEVKMELLDIVMLLGTLFNSVSINSFK